MKLHGSTLPIEILKAPRMLSENLELLVLKYFMSIEVATPIKMIVSMGISYIGTYIC